MLITASNHNQGLERGWREAVVAYIKQPTISKIICTRGGEKTIINLSQDSR
jgi:hypothetical protein